MCKFCYFLFILLLLGCKTPSSSFSTNLQELDKLLSLHPKAVSDSLSRLEVSRMNKADRAYFYLLETSAKDKNYRKLDNDSTLRIAEKYFTQTGDSYNLGRTQYYIAKYFFNTNNPTDAFRILKAAEHNIHNSPTTDLHLLGLIYSQHGTLQGRQNNYQEAQNYYQKSFDIFCEIKDTTSMLTIAKQLAWMYICQEKYEQSKKILLEAITLIEKITHNNNSQINNLHASLLNALSYYYQNTSHIQEAISTEKKAIEILNNNNLTIPSNFYSTLINSLQQINDTIEINHFCKQMLIQAEKEKNLVTLIKAYKLRITLEETKGNFKQAYTLQKKYISLKDDYNKQLKFNEVIKLEKKYNYSEKERLFYKAQTKNLWLFIFILILTIIATLILLYSSWLQRRLKKKNLQLAEQIKKVEWGLTLSKELMKDNFNQYTQLEKILNRYASQVPQQLFEEFRSLHHSQQIHYSQRLLFSLTNINNEFTQKLKQKHPNLTSNDILLASMLHYQWELDDIAQVFRTSLEAIQKRRSRLKTKLERKGDDIKNLEKYLIRI